MSFSADQRALVITCLLLTVGVALLGNQPFFWDTVVLAERSAEHYLTLLNGHWPGWGGLLPPKAGDPGHPALWGMYLGLCWKLFDKSLLVSHIATLPWLWGIAAQVTFLTRHVTGTDGHAWKSLLLLLALPPFAGHLALVSPDLALLCLFLLALRGLLTQQKATTALALFFMGLVSLRAIPLMVALFGLSLLPHVSSKKINVFIKNIASWIPVFVIGATGIVAWITLRYLTQGWILSYPGSPWEEQRGFVSATMAIRNAALTGFWLLQYGAIFITGSALWLALRNRKAAFRSPLFRLMVLTGLCMACFTVPFSNPINPRYWLPVLLTATLWVVEVSVQKGWKPAFYLILALPMLTGHLWLLPPPRANAWDATLAHVWATAARKDAEKQLITRNINPASVGTLFPLLAPPPHTFLEDRPGFHELSPATDSLIWYSNLCNGYSDSLFAALHTHWQPVFTVQRGPVEVSLLKRTLPALP